MKRYTSTLYFGIFVTLVCLLPLEVAAGEPPEAAPAFAKTGLLSHPGETAEEILLRAHEYDTEAIALVIAGYHQGLGGFLHDGSIARAWTVFAVENFVPDADSSFLQLMSDNESPPTAEESAEWLAGCEHARKSRFARIFAQAGIFDIHATCRDLQAHRQEANEWKKAYASTLEAIDEHAENNKALIRLIRELTARPMTDEDEKRLSENEVSNRSVIFWAATSHDPEQERPDWKTERLIDFIALRKAENTAYARRLAGDASGVLMQRLAGTPDFLVRQIREAHNGSLEAASILGQQYMSGGMNFPSDVGLSVLWTRHAAQSGDPRFTELRAVQLFGLPFTDAAWPWAKLTEEYGEAPARERARHLMRVIEETESKENLEKMFAQWLHDMRTKRVSKTSE